MGLPSSPEYSAQVPAGRTGESEDVAALALHLCSDEAGYTTGQVISPVGGLWRYGVPLPQCYLCVHG